MVRRRQLTCSILTAAAFFGCKDTLSSDGGGLAINVQFSESAANASFDAARIRIIGETDRTVNTTPGAEEVIEGLAPGSYRVVLEGLEGDDVELLGQQNNVSVTAGNVTDVTVTFSSFVPVLDAAPAPSPTLRFDVEYGAVPGASSYVIEADVDENFTNPIEVTSTGTEAEVPGEQGQTYYVRVRAVTEFSTVSAPSQPETFVVQAEVANLEVTPADLDTLIGAGDTVQYSAAIFDAKGDEFTGAAISWTTDNGAVATVDSEGRLFAQANGTTDVIANSGGIEGQGTFTSLTMQADSTSGFTYTIAGVPIGLTWDGEMYLVTNGGSQTGRVYMYDPDGVFLDSVVTVFDARSIHYNEDDDAYYMKSFQFAWVELDPSTGDTTLLHNGFFVESQSSVDLTPDGSTIIEHARDSVRLLDAETGAETDLFTGIQFGPAGSGHDISVVTDGRFFYTWTNTPATTIFAYDRQGRLVTSLEIPVAVSGAGGYSLSYANGQLWFAATGTPSGIMRGYTLTPADPDAPPALRRTISGPTVSDSARRCPTKSTIGCD